MTSITNPSVFVDIGLLDPLLPAPSVETSKNNPTGKETQGSSWGSVPRISGLAILSIGSLAIVSTLAASQTNLSSNTHHLRSPLQPAITTSSGSSSEVHIINDLPYDLQLSSTPSPWGTGVDCYNHSCSKLLAPGEVQVINVEDGSTTSDGLGLDYDAYSSNGYETHIHTNILGDKSITLTNQDGTVALATESDTPYDYHIQAILSPSVAPVTSPPSNPPIPSLSPTSAPPTTNKPTPAPITSSPSVSLTPTSSPGSNIENSVWYIDWTTWFTELPTLSLKESI